jgi:hypothetical protein
MRRKVRRFFSFTARHWDYLLADAAERLAWATGSLRKSGSFVRRWAKKLENRVVGLSGLLFPARVGAHGFRRVLLSLEQLEDRVVPSSGLSVNMPPTSSNGVQFATGAALITTYDLSSTGVGPDWGQTRSFSSIGSNTTGALTATVG